MIRQEHLRLLAPGETADVTVPAVAVTVAYRGQSAQVAVEALGRRLRLAVRPDAPVKAGDAGRVGWAMSESRLIR